MSGLVMTFVEAPDDLQKSGLKIPQDHLDTCTKQGLPIAGNAAGNTVDLFDLKGARTSPAPLPEGFTPRGIVALTFSIIAGLVGIAVIAWYGAGEIGKKAPKGTVGGYNTKMVAAEGKKQGNI